MNTIFTDARITDILIAAMGALAWLKLRSIDKSINEMAEKRIECLREFATKKQVNAIDTRVDKLSERVSRVEGSKVVVHKYGETK